MYFEIFNEKVAVDQGLDATKFYGYLPELVQECEKNVELYKKLYKFNINIVFVGKDEMSDLNKEYRQVELPTDVLSFVITDSVSEIYLCPEYILEKLKESELEISLTNEVFALLVHGVLHLAGYTHEGYLHWGDKYEGVEEMFILQSQIVNVIKD